MDIFNTGRRTAMTLFWRYRDLVGLFVVRLNDTSFVNLFCTLVLFLDFDIITNILAPSVKVYDQASHGKRHLQTSITLR